MHKSDLTYFLLQTNRRQHITKSDSELQLPLAVSSVSNAGSGPYWDFLSAGELFVFMPFVWVL